MNSQSGGVSAGFLLFLVFLVLKLTGVITWSWLWVTAPLWIPLAFVLSILAIAAIITAFFENRHKKRRPKNLS